MRNTAQPAHIRTQPTATRHATPATPPEQRRRTNRTEEIHAALFSDYRSRKA
jgi:hypothetical protein